MHERGERCALRPGNVHSADDWEEVLKLVIARCADHHVMRFFRADSAFAIPELYKTLEAAGYFYAIWLRVNRVLQGRIAHLLKRPVGRPPKGVNRVYGDGCIRRHHGTSPAVLSHGSNGIRVSCSRAPVLSLSTDPRSGTGSSDFTISVARQNSTFLGRLLQNILPGND